MRFLCWESRRKPLCFFFYRTKLKMENVVFWLKQILNLKLCVFYFSPVCWPKIVRVVIQDPAVAYFFSHHECLEQLKQRYERGLKNFEEQVLRTSRKNSFENSVTCEDLELPTNQENELPSCIGVQVAIKTSKW